MLQNLLFCFKVSKPNILELQKREKMLLQKKKQKKFLKKN
jgi:hypothetical protein